MKKYNSKGFTLIEILIAITIFSIMFISIMSVYMVSTTLTYKSDLNRFMQENTKNIVTNIGEDILKNGILGVAKELPQIDCHEVDGNLATLKGDKLCTTNTRSYYLAEQGVNGKYTRITNSDCKQTDGQPRKQCFLVLDDNGNTYPLSNNLVTVENLKFFLTGGEKIQKKITMTLTLAITPNSGVKEEFVQDTKLTTQITFSERNYK